jgi:glycosyltransferase involved in cell wall biosynthesis
MPDGRPWPRISIVTPSFNQGAFIEETILSVLAQNYPNLEHIVIDGGSTDETSAVLHGYRDRLAYVASEKDEGQSHAINKGMAVATGEILTWLNSDDMLAPGALFAMAIAFATSGADLVAGIAAIFRDGRLVHEHLTACDDGALPLDDLLDLENGWNVGQFFYQPEVFFTRDLWHRAGGYVDRSCYYSMDYELWLRFAEQKAKLHVIGRPIACFRQHDAQKTHIESRFKAELQIVRQQYLERTGYRPVRTPRAAPTASRPLRVTLLNDHGYRRWGAGIAHARLAAALRRVGCDVSMVAFREGPHRIPRLGRAEPAALAAHIAKFNPDLVLLGNVHGAEIEPDILSELFERWPTLIVLHDLWWLTGRCVYPSGCGKYLTGCDASCPTPDEYPKRAPERIAGAWDSKQHLLRAGRSPILLGQSAWAVATARAAFAGKAPPRVERITLGFPLDVFKPRDRLACRRMLKLPLDRFIVLFSATVLADQRKGGDQLRALAQNLRLPDLLFVATGHGTAADLGVPDDMFTALGYIEDPERMALILSAADLLVAPSAAETFGQVFVESIASGTPAIGHRLAGSTDALVDGVTGLMARTPDAAALEEAVMALYRDRDRRDAISFWGRAYAENEWSMESCGQHFIAMLRRLGVIDELGRRHRIDLKRGG